MSGDFLTLVLEAASQAPCPSLLTRLPYHLVGKASMRELGSLASTPPLQAPAMPGADREHSGLQVMGLAA